jgi:hypothetical protein
MSREAFLLFLDDEFIAVFYEIEKLSFLFFAQTQKSLRFFIYQWFFN